MISTEDLIRYGIAAFTLVGTLVVVWMVLTERGE